MFNDLLKYTFLQNAFITALLAGIMCGIIGVIVVEKKLLMMAGGIAHTAYGGVGLGYLIGFEPIIGAGIFAIGSAIVIGTVNRKVKLHTDIIISILWSLGMASGIGFTALMGAYPPDMSSYLFGNILTVTKNDLLIMLPLTALNFLIFTSFYNDWKAFLFDSAFAKMVGIKTVFLEYLLLIMISLSIVVLIRVVGIILLIALITAPAAISNLVCKSLSGRMIISAILAFLFCLVGIVVSYYFAFPSGVATIFFAGITYFVTLILKKTLAKNN